ncbi:LysR family transcriptional regulator [Pigmentiphaga soli]|uniref:LysR family transcriptional regulator n=1 Tax=Pigmentiphaga soli TaxID=1007095 RepID=A0ABP8HQR0_9BURK
MDSASEIAFFMQIAKHGSLTMAARAMGITPAALSKRLAQLERRLNVRLINRNTRSLSLTGEGRLYLERGSAVLAELEELERALSTIREEPVGQLRINASLNFGRVRLAPVISAFMREYPRLEVALDLSDHPKDLVEGGFDLAIRLGAQPDSGLRARRLATNSRYLCASPTYLERHGTPTTLADLARHECIVVDRQDTPYGVWTFVLGNTMETVKVHGRMACNDGEVALNWALDHHGIMMRSGWDIARLVRANRLRVVLPQYRLPARDVFVVFHDSSRQAPKVRVFIDFVARMLTELDNMDAREIAGQGDGPALLVKTAPAPRPP